MLCPLREEVTTYYYNSLSGFQSSDLFAQMVKGPLGYGISLNVEPHFRSLRLTRVLKRKLCTSPKIWALERLCCEPFNLALQLQIGDTSMRLEIALTRKMSTTATTGTADSETEMIKKTATTATRTTITKE